ncbi:EAL domain-containing protein [Tumidithrix elongata RA019]|uniref:EAL domain-containing protein n=1 Tax=Tumidithrix elongata BACA0141 TaxID=2716417 RepID=A0AAW9PYK2_9CYAN|nr:EAL domain-containing protein [Tumidithrix elongata RA019]
MTSQPTPAQVNSSKGDILIVDDVPENLELLTTILTQQGYKVRSVLNGKTGLKVAKAVRPDLILLDINMPEMDGYQVCQRLKFDPVTQPIPVIFLSALDRASDKVKAFGMGGIDYIPKPFQAEELLARVKNHLDLRFAQEQIQKLNSELEARVIQRTAQLEMEIAERTRIQNQLLHVAMHDLLTNLPNRTFLTQRLMQIFDRNRQAIDESLVLILLECDQLPSINNSLGHQAGDRLIVSIARRLESCLQSGTLLAHCGNDTFAILLENCPQMSEAMRIAKSLYQETQLPFGIDGHLIHIKVCIGIVQGDRAYKNSKHLLRDANTAMHQAKTAGKANIQVFNAAMHNRALSFFEIQNELHQALKAEELYLVYQPIASLRKNTIKGVEALIRWQHPQRGLIMPGEFISVAEETGLVIQFDRYVLDMACTQLREWQKQGLSPLFRMQVNLSAQQLTQPDFLDFLDKTIKIHQVNTQNLALEITENALMQQREVVLKLLDELKTRQIHVSIDDFGTGYSSLSYLHHLKVENLKIDRSFITLMEVSKDNLGIVRTIVNLAHDLGMTVTAEGVETAQQLEQLKNLNCEFFQGYFLGKPMDVNTVTSKIFQENCLSYI